MASEKEENQVQTAVRIPESWFARLDKIADRMSQPGLPIKRTEALRLAIARGMAELEAEGGKKR
jgi:hypothetical protein